MVNIYDYTDPAKFLSDVFEDKKAANPMFSLRSWAKNLGMKSHGPIHAMLKGERTIPKKYVPKLINSLKLNIQESKFFEALVDFSRAKNLDEKEFYLSKLQTLSPKEFREIDEMIAYKYNIDPLHHIIAEMSELKNFKNDVRWIKSKIRAGSDIMSVETVLNRLIALGVLKEEGGVLKKQIQHIYTKNDIMDRAIQEYHKKMGEVAVSQIARQAVEEREFSGVTFNIQKKHLPEIKEAIREFSNNLIQSYEAKSKEGEETYHLNIQFFSLTK